MKVDLESYEQYARFNNKGWSPENDVHLRIIFLKFFASILGAYNNFIEHTTNQVFNLQAFFKKRTRATQQPVDEMVRSSYCKRSGGGAVGPLLDAVVRSSYYNVVYEFAGTSIMD